MESSLGGMNDAALVQLLADLQQNRGGPLSPALAAVQAVRQSEERYRLMTEHVKVGIIASS